MPRVQPLGTRPCEVFCSGVVLIGLGLAPSRWRIAGRKRPHRTCNPEARPACQGTHSPQPRLLACLPRPSCQPADAHRHGQDHHAALAHHLVPAGPPRGRQAHLLHPHRAGDGKGGEKALLAASLQIGQGQKVNARACLCGCVGCVRRAAAAAGNYCCASASAAADELILAGQPGRRQGSV